MKKSKKNKKSTRGPAIVETYETEIEYDCPVRGRVKQKVLVKRIANVEATEEPEVLEAKSLALKLDKLSSILPQDEDEEEEESIYD